MSSFKPKAVNATSAAPATQIESNITTDSASDIFEDAFDSDSSFGDGMDKPTGITLDNENRSSINPYHDDYTSQVEALAVSMAPGKQRSVMDNDQNKISTKDGKHLEKDNSCWNATNLDGS